MKKKEPKDQLVKARVTQQMKAAVLRAAAAESGGVGGGEAESIIVRKALAEYLRTRGYLLSGNPAPIVALKVAENPPKFRAKRKHSPGLIRDHKL